MASAKTLSAPTMSDENVIFLQVGKTGVGKSAVGNSILGQDVFECKNSPYSVTKEIFKKSAERERYHITVVDTPGFMATEHEKAESILKACEDMRKAMSVCPYNGKLAVIFVIRYGERFTEENKTCLKILETIFGKNNIWKSCIIVMTYGDNFDIDYENKPFLEYINEQSGEFGELFKKCNYLCVLFRNKTKNDEEKRDQFKMLMDCVGYLDQGYTHNKFQEAIKGQNRIELEAKLPTLKKEKLQDVQSLADKIRNIQFSSESSRKLEDVEHDTLKILASVDEQDTPEKIYYIDNETRLLEDIRSSVLEQLHLIETKKEEFRQMKITQDFQSRIEGIKMKISQTDPRHKEILSSLNSFEENIKSTNKQIKKENLTNDCSESLKLSIEGSRQELENLKLRAQQAEEVEINEKKEDIIQRLNNVSTHDNDATENLRILKNEIIFLKESLEKEHKLINKQFVKVIKSSMTQILRDIKDKEETIRQFKYTDDLNVQIKNIKQEIINTKQINEETDSFVADVGERLKSLKTLVKKEQLRKEFTDSLKISILEAKNMFETLKNEVQRNKETEIKILLESISDRVYQTYFQDEEALYNLSQAGVESISLMCKLDQDKKKITDGCFLTTKLELNKLVKEIELKQERAQQSIRTNQIMKKINDLTTDIDQINQSDINISETISKLKAEMLQLQKETNESNVGEKSLQRLNEAVRTAEKMILIATNWTEKVRKEKIEKEIKEIEKQIHTLDLTSGSCEQETKQIKAHLSDLQSKIKQEELNEGDKAYLMSTVESMHSNINSKNKDTKQKAIAAIIKKEIQDVMKQIGQISINQENILISYTNFKLKVNALRENIAEAKISDALKTELFSDLKVAKEMLKKRNKETIDTIESDIKFILQNIAEANPDDANITLAQSTITEKLLLLKQRIGDQYKQQYEDCENRFALLVSRVDSFNEMKEEIESLFSRIKLLGIPCRPFHFSGFREDVAKIRDDLYEKIEDKNDLYKLSERTDLCLKTIEIKSNNNKKKIASNVFRFVPIIGPVIGHVITVGIDEHERTQLMKL